MVNDQLMSSDDPDFFLEYLLRCALTAPGAETSPTAGRILARLLVVGAIEGGDELITPYLVPMPEEDASFEVRTYRPGDLVPTDIRDGLRAAAALKIALRGARDSDEGIEEESRTASGLERCVLVRDSTGDFEFRFAGSETLIGEPGECSAARNAWEATLAHWRSWVPLDGSDRDEPRWRPIATSLFQALGPASTTVVEPPEAQPSPPDFSGMRYETESGWWVPSPPGQPSGRFQDRDEYEEPEDVGEPDDAGVAGAGVQPGGEDADEADGYGLAADEYGEYGLPEDDPFDPVDGGEPAFDSMPAPPTLVEARPEPGGRTTDPLSTTLGEPLSAAIREAIANLVVEVDLSQVEPLIRRALDDDRRELVEPLARRLSARLGDTLDLPTTAALVEALAQVVPRPGDLAEAVAAEVGALLSETILRRRPGDPGIGVDGFHVMAGIEQLQVRLDGLQDQLQKSAALLQAMGDHLDAGDRRAAIAERITTSVDQEMQRLASRIDEQVTALAGTAGGGSELADGVARLTRKLRQSVAQFDRALVRLDEVVDQAGGDRVKQLALARRAEQVVPVAPVGPVTRR